MSTPCKTWGNTCLNPLNKKGHGKGKDLRLIPESLRLSLPNSVPTDGKLCSSCRKVCNKLFEKKSSPLTENCAEISNNEDVLVNYESSDEESEGYDDDNDDDDYSPLVVSTLSKKVSLECNDDYHNAGVEVLEQIKEKFKNSASFSEKLVLLTLAPKSWSRKKVAVEFNASEWQVRKAKELVAENGILSSPNPKKGGRKMSTETETLVKAFYEDDEYSRLLPGMKDFVSVRKEDGSREQVQKRLILSNLSELHYRFTEEHPNEKIGFTKFSQLRPRHCVLAGSSGTHTVCVCTHHENVKLMLEAMNVEKITLNSTMPLKSYHDCLQQITCNVPTALCHLGKCDLCPNIEHVKNNFSTLLNDSCIEKVEYQIWQHTDRSTLKTEVVDTDDFVEQLSKLLLKLKPHDFISRMQSAYVTELKRKLQEDEFLIQCDFAENYAFVVQNAAQSFHWNNDQCSIFTVVLYYMKEGDLKHRSLAILSDNLKHDTIAVYEYQKIIVSYLKTNFTPSKIFYSTDGAAQHFKNKFNFKNLLFHERDFGITAEWHFYATAHGKSPCDGIGGNLKRLAARASLQASAENKILTPESLYHWAKENLIKTTVLFSSKSDYDITAETLKPRFAEATTIPGTLKFHAVIPMDDSKLMLKEYSSATDYEIFPKIKSRKRKSMK